MNERTFTLLELNSLLSDAVSEAFPDRYWVQAEISEMHTNYSGHCYLELIEKDRSGKTVAKARASIWNNTFRLLRPYFEQTAGQTLHTGLKILVQVAVSFHELYGLNLTVTDIDPVYTLGDAARRRAEILKQLTDDGVIDMNKELEWAQLPQRIAVISSGTAAGYGDFIDQLDHNRYGYRFYTRLFAAVMQGEQTESSVIAALNRIACHADRFDGVVIIRGGGATSDLSSFDSYLLAANVAQFPLPVITGIGHERDDTVLDAVANIRVKTPTAAAEWLIGKVHAADMELRELNRALLSAVRQKIDTEKQSVQRIAQNIPLWTERSIHTGYSRLKTLSATIHRESNRQIAAERNRIGQMTHTLAPLTDRRIGEQRARIGLAEERLRQSVRQILADAGKHIETLGQMIDLVSPDTILRRGYTLTLNHGKAVQSPDDVQPGDKLQTLLPGGSIWSEVTDIDKQEQK